MNDRQRAVMMFCKNPMEKVMDHTIEEAIDNLIGLLKADINDLKQYWQNGTGDTYGAIKTRAFNLVTDRQDEDLLALTFDLARYIMAEPGFKNAPYNVICTALIQARSEIGGDFTWADLIRAANELDQMLIGLPTAYANTNGESK
jgi:hypothetical protein